MLRRLQTVIFSGHALINSWRIPNPPWKQSDIKKNLEGEQMDTASYYTDECRKLFELRMQLLPYLYSAFVEYSRTGKPPIRALVMDYPEDENLRMVDDEYLFGDSLLICPLTYEDGVRRKAYFPKGRWHNFFTDEVLDGGKEVELHAEYSQIPVFVKEGAIVPLAKPVPHVDKETIFEMEIRIFGEADGSFTLYEDDFETFDYMNEKNSNIVTIEKHPGENMVVQRHGINRERYQFKQLRIKMCGSLHKDI